MTPRPLLATALAVGALLALLAIGASTASADCWDDECSDRRSQSWSKPRVEAGFGLLAGSYTVATISGGAVGMHFDGGVRMGRLALLGEYDFLSVGESAYDNADPVRGVLHRAGANARYSFLSVGGRNLPLRGDFWVEGGVGTQLVQWDGGGELSRRDLSYGIGGQLTARVGKHKPTYLGFYYAFRGLLARDPFPGKRTPTCAGPCDTATSPSTWDSSAFFNFGIVFSR